MSILVVENNVASVGLLKESLGLDESQLDIVDTAARAYAKLAEATPALILLDLVLPDAHGFEILRRIRRDSRLDRVPVLVLTCLADAFYKARALSFGADGFIIKPVRPAELREQIRAALERGRPEAGEK